MSIFAKASNDERAAINHLLKTGADHSDMTTANKSLGMYAEALESTLRKAIFDCDNIETFGIFESVPFDHNCAMFTVDPIQPGFEQDYKAYVVPDCSCMPCARLEADYVTVPMYEIGNCVEWCAKRVGQGNYNIAQRATEALMGGMTKKKNDDAWHVILAAGVDRNVVAFDDNAAQGQFTKRLVIQAKTFMRRNGGGNAQCGNRSRLTDIFMSPEAMDDIYNWNIDQVDELTRREIHTSPNCDMGMTSLFCVRLNILDELGVNQEYQDYYTSDLNGVITSGKQEILIGLDLSTRDSFVSPTMGQMEVIADNTKLISCRTQALRAYQTVGYAALSSRRVLLMAI